MMTKINSLMESMKRIDTNGIKSQNDSSLRIPLDKQEKTSFSSYLQDQLAELNQEQKSADKMGTDISVGKSENIHEAMLSLSHAELNFKYAVQVRNKVLEAYQEIMKMQV